MMGCCRRRCVREICATRVRYGYRRVHVLLRREGRQINSKKTHRIYNELGLQLRNKRPKRRVRAKLREDRREATSGEELLARTVQGLHVRLRTALHGHETNRRPHRCIRRGLGIVVVNLLHFDRTAAAALMSARPFTSRARRDALQRASEIEILRADMGR